jgi:flagellar biosynthesis/type III secretory pathway chaperone
MAIAPQFEKLMAGCQDMALSHLRPLMDRMFENADVALLEFAEKAESNTAQSLFFEAMGEVRKKRSAIEQQFYTELKQGFANFPSKPEGQPQSAHDDTGLGTLSLLDTEEVETWVATQNATSKLASRIMDQIFALKQRLSVVNGGDAIEENQIPSGAAWLGCAFQHAVEQLELENKVRIVFIALFEKYVLSQADALFREYNKRLIEHGILQNLRYEVRKQPGGVEIVETSDSDQSAEDDEEAYAENSVDQHPPSENGDELFGRICELITGRRSSILSRPGGANNVTAIASGGSAASAFAGGGYAGVHPSENAGGMAGGMAGGNAGENAAGTGAAGIGSGSPLVSQIHKLQSQIQSGTTTLSSSEFIENIEIDENLIGQLQNTLADEREKIFGGLDRRKIPVADTNVIELVGMLFEYMLKEETLPNIVKALLSRLHTPLLKVAVVDRNFFTQAQHSARMLLNNMTSAGIHWVEENQIERGIFPKMKEIVDRVLLDYKEDVAIFDDLVKDFNKAVKDLDHRANVIEKRTTEAADGQEKLQAARHRAQQEVRARCQGKPVPASTQEFLQRIWADKLTFILLRDQQDKGEDWRAATALAERIVEYSLPPSSEEQRSKRQQSLADFQKEIRDATQTLQQANKQNLLGALFDTQNQALDTLAPASVDQGQTQQAFAPEEPAQEQVAQSVSPAPEQEAMLEELKAIPFGTWFEFSDADKPKTQVKLSWRSTVTEKFMFVDQMGVKATIIPMHELATGMLNNSVRIVNTEKKPFVDRALNAIHRMLDRAA